MFSSLYENSFGLADPFTDLEDPQGSLDHTLRVTGVKSAQSQNKTSMATPKRYKPLV